MLECPIFTTNLQDEPSSCDDSWLTANERRFNHNRKRGLEEGEEDCSKPVLRKDSTATVNLARFRVCSTTDFT